MKPSVARAATRPVMLDPLERQLLETLARLGPISSADLPTRWPLIRMHVPVLLDRLVAAGLVRRGPSPDVGGAVMLTELGDQVARNGA